MEAAGNYGEDPGFFLAVGLTAAEKRKRRVGEAVSLLSRQSVCYSRAHSEAGAGPGGHAKLGKMQLLLSKTALLGHEIRQAPGRRVGGRCISGCRTFRPI